MKIKAMREEEQKAKMEKMLKFGRPGKGQNYSEYKWLCKGCFTEYLIDLPDKRCNKCGSICITPEERKIELDSKVEDTFHKENRAQIMFLRLNFVKISIFLRSKFKNFVLGRGDEAGKSSTSVP